MTLSHVTVQTTTLAHAGCAAGVHYLRPLSEITLMLTNRIVARAWNLLISRSWAGMNYVCKLFLARHAMHATNISCDVDGLWSRNATKSGNRYVTVDRCLGYTCMPSPTRIIISGVWKNVDFLCEYYTCENMAYKLLLTVVTLFKDCFIL